MNSSERGLRRLLYVYQLLERTRLEELQRAANSVAEVERAIQKQGEILRSAGAEGVAALDQGLREGWLYARSEVEVATRRGVLLQDLCLSRRETRTAAQEGYIESRVRTEQIKALHRAALDDAFRKETRRQQLLADEHYLIQRRRAELERLETMRPV